MKRIFLLVGIMTLGFALRIYALDDANMNWDEGYTNWIIHLQFDEMIETTARDVHPPLYYIILRLVHTVTGDGEFLLRYPSVVIGMLAIALSFALGRMVAGHAVGVIAMILMAVARSNIEISQLMRMHILAVVFATGGMWATLLVWRNPYHKVAGITYVICTAGALYSFYLAVVFPLAANLAFLVIWLRQNRPRHLLVIWSALQVAAIGLFLPWVWYSLQRMHGWNAGQSSDFIFFLQAYFVILTTGVSVYWEAYIPWVLSGLIAMAIGTLLIYLKANRSNNQMNSLSLLLSSVVTPILVVYMLTLPFHDLGRPLAARYLVLLAAGFYVLAAWAIAHLAKRRPLIGYLAGTLIMGLAIVGLVDTQHTSARQDLYASIGQLLTAHRQDNDTVLMYVDHDWPILESAYDGAWVKVPYGSRLDTPLAALILEPVWVNSAAVWVVKNPAALQTDPTGEIERWLQERAIHVQSWRFNQNTLTVYVKEPERVATIQDLVEGYPLPDAPIDRSIGLIDVQTSLKRVGVGDDVQLALFWSWPPPETVEIELADRTTVQSFTFAPPTVSQGPVRQQIRIPLPADLPEGDYKIRMTQPTELELETITVVNTIGDIYANESDIDHRLDWVFGDSIELLGYNISDTNFSPGEAVEVILYWRTKEVLDTRYKILVYTLGDWNPATDTPLWGQHDSEPLNWRVPTTEWQPGRIIRDVHRFEIMDIARPGQYLIGVVMYGLLDGTRLPISDAQCFTLGDMATLTPVTIE